MNDQLGLYVLLLLIGFFPASLSNYCNLCDNKGSHTMCRFPKAGPAAQCLEYERVPLSDEEKDLVVNQHNFLRNKVALGLENRGHPGPQPPAANMRQLSWDNELANIAQRWADQCIKFHSPYQHDECRITDTYSAVGQNIAASGSTGEYSAQDHLKKWVTMWYDEVDHFNRDIVKSFGGFSNSYFMKIGHYTQLVWANTHSVGCGRVVFKEYVNGNYWTFGRLVCNYAPAGNFEMQPLYSIGSECTACPRGTKQNPKMKGLCSTSSQLTTVKSTAESSGNAIALYNGIIFVWFTLFLV